MEFSSYSTTNNTSTMQFQSFNHFAVAFSCFICWQSMCVARYCAGFIERQCNLRHHYAAIKLQISIFKRYMSTLSSFMVCALTVSFLSFFVFHWVVGAFFMFVFFQNIKNDVREYVNIMERLYQTTNKTSSCSFIEYRMIKYCDYNPQYNKYNKLA